MKAYIKPLMGEHHVFPSSGLLNGSPGRTENAEPPLANAQGLVHDQFEQGLQQLGKESLFSGFMPSNDDSLTFRPVWDE